MGIKHTRHDLTGKRFGKLVALSFINTRRREVTINRNGCAAVIRR